MRRALLRCYVPSHLAAFCSQVRGRLRLFDAACQIIALVLNNTHLLPANRQAAAHNAEAAQYSVLTTIVAKLIACINGVVRERRWPVQEASDRPVPEASVQTMWNHVTRPPYWQRPTLSTTDAHPFI